MSVGIPLQYFFQKTTKNAEACFSIQAIQVCIPSSLFSHLRWATPWLHQQEGCGWVVLPGHKKRCTMYYVFSEKNKRAKNCSCFLLQFVPSYTLFPSQYGEVEFVQRKNSQDSMQRQHSAESIAVGESLSGRLKLVELSRWVLQYRLEPANLLDIVVSIGWWTKYLHGKWLF